MSWTEIDSALLPNGDRLTLRRNADAYEIRIGLYELMSSKNPVSERAMARLAAERVPKARRVLIGGLGMGYTVRAVLDLAAPETMVTVAELNPAIVAWNRGLLAELASRPLDDPRVTVFTGNVADALAPGAYDHILMDVDNGPEAVLFEGNGAFYSAAGIARLLAALRPGGVMAVWAAAPSPAFETAAKGLTLERIDVPVPGAVVHSIYLAAAKMPGPEDVAGACKAARRPI